MIVMLASCNDFSKKDLVGDWEVVKAEVDGMDISRQFLDPTPQWISLDANGYYESGKQLKEKDGSWKFKSKRKLLTLNHLNEWWSDSSWRVEKQGNYLLLTETKMITKKVILKPLEKEKPTLTYRSDTDQRIRGKWRLLRFKKNLKLVGKLVDQNQWVEFLETGKFLAGSDAGSTSGGDWILNKGEISLVNEGSLVNSSWIISFMSNKMIFSNDEMDAEWQMIWVRAGSMENTQVTYIANEGVLIERNGKKVLIDAVHDFYDENYLPTPFTDFNKMINRKDPFENIEYLLISHPHGDHFDPEMTIQFLNNHPEAELPASSQVYDSLSRIHSFEAVSGNIYTIPAELDKPFEVKKNGVGIEVVYLKHVNERHPWIQNLGHLIEIDGIRFLHVGDADLTATIPEMDYQDRNIDVAILPYWYFWESDEAQKVLEFIDPKVIIATHISPANRYNEIERVKASRPDAIIFFQEGDSWSGN